MAMPDLDKNEKEPKKWHQKWWGVIFLLALAIIVLYCGAFIYQVVALVEGQSQISYNNFNDSQQNAGANIQQLVETTDDPTFGAGTAGIVIVEFSDFQCPYCKEEYAILKRIRQEYQAEMKIIYRDFPNLASHPDSVNAALAGQCAAEQGNFWSYHDLLFENQSNLKIENLKILAVTAGLDSVKFSQCLDSQKYLGEAQNDLQDGVKFGINGTPTFFINGYKIAGVIPYDAWKTLLDKLKQAKVQAEKNSQ